MMYRDYWEEESSRHSVAGAKTLGLAPTGDGGFPWCQVCRSESVGLRRAQQHLQQILGQKSWETGSS